MGWDTPMRSARRLLAALVLALAATALHVAAPARTLDHSAASPTATVYGVVTGRNHSPLRVDIALFTADWRYLGKVLSTKGGVFRIGGLEPGTYRLQATDRRHEWDIDKLARTDAIVSVGEGQSAERDIVMARGAFVTGKVKVGPHGATGKRATVAVASEYGVSYTTTADKLGRFAIGGLPGGQRYSVFTWDRSKKWTGKSIWVGRLKSGKGRDLTVRLKKPTSSYAGILRVNGVPTSGRIWATVVSRANGQWYTAPIDNGDLSRFRGLYPGGYTLLLPRTGQIADQQISMPPARAGRTTIVRLDAQPVPPAG